MKPRALPIAAVLLGLAGPSVADDRPNILWITCEDISPDLGCYGDEYAVTPRLDRLASESVRYTRAFAPIGVCAPARSTIITGMYPPSFGTQHMRCAGQLPAGAKEFPATSANRDTIAPTIPRPITISSTIHPPGTSRAARPTGETAKPISRSSPSSISRSRTRARSAFPRPNIASKPPTSPPRNATIPPRRRSPRIIPTSPRSARTGHGMPT